MARRGPTSVRGPAADTARWRAVERRDRGADGAFVYGVSSTGIYCRPSCPSRRPLRARVRFFDDPAAAERAGFRACRRCHPAAEASEDPWIARVRRACALLDDSEGQVSLGRLAAEVGGSPYHLQRTFKRIVGVTPRAYAEACRLGKVRRQLKGGSAVTRAIFDAGYGSVSRFYERAAPTLGMTASHYRTGGAGMVVQYAVVSSPVGRLLGAATEGGLCAVSLGSRDADLVAALREEFPAATLTKSPTALASFLSAIVANLDGTRPHLDLPLDVRATAFQWQVWTALRAIPRGETRTYSELAASIGRPTACRAVARACATNPVAVVIPCHRIVPAAGGVGGYRWGPERKQRMLARERA